MKKLILTTALVMVSSMSFAETANENNNILGGTINNNNVADTGNTYVDHATGSGNTTVEAATPNGYVSLPGLAVAGGSDICLGSSSAGISAAGIGISGGSTTVDENCVMMKQVKLLNGLGLKDAAVALLITQDEGIAEAIFLAYPDLFNTLMGTDQ